MLVDGEHYPPVVVAALDDLRSRGVEPVAALYLGGTEKVAGYGAGVDLGVPVHWTERGATAAVDIPAAARALRELIARHGPDVVIDLSDEPILDPRRRLQLASHVLLAGVQYTGADFTLTPPPRPRLSQRPTIAVIGTGKRTGKTSVSGDIVRRLIQHGSTPVVVAMGRGGPAEPVVVAAGTPLDPAALLAVVDAGGHAASDFYEDAVTTGAATVGARRCGGGLSGAVGYTNASQAIAAAEELNGDVLVLEGSGASIPPAAADATVLIVPADCDPEFLLGYLGPYRVLLADLIIVTMAEEPRGTADRRAAVREALAALAPATPILETVLRPVPLAPVAGRRVFFATTAHPSASAVLVEALESSAGCEVVGVSHRLSDRPALREDLKTAAPFDTLLVELKAAAVDVAARFAADTGVEVVFCDNRPVLADGAAAVPSDEALARAVAELAAVASQRATAR